MKIFTAFCILISFSALSALYLPLAVKETGGAARTAAPTQSGIPLPKGKFQPADLPKFAILDSATLTPQPCGFSVTATWDDGSIRFLNTQFPAAVAAGQTARYYLADNSAAIDGPGEITVTQSAGAITVVTGPLKFSIKAANFNVIDEAYADLTGEKNFDTDHRIIAPGNAGFLKIGGTTTAAATAVLTLASQTSQRAIIKAEVTAGAHKFLLYYTAFRNKPYVQIICDWYFNNGTASAVFNLTDLSIHLATEVTGSRHVVASHEPGDSLAFDIASTENAELSYTNNDAYFIATGSTVHGTGKGMLTPGIAEEKRMGWMHANAGAKGIGGGIRYMWQMAPKMIELLPDGQLVLGLRRSKSPVMTYYGGGGRTHTVFVSFGNSPENTREAFWTVTKPLFAAAPMVWNCGMTKALSPNFVHADPALLSSRAGTQVQRNMFFNKYKNLYLTFGHPYRKAPAMATDIADLYAFERFGNCTEEGSFCGEQAYSGNYYDFPHLAVLGFIIGGSVENLELAWIHDLHMMNLHLDNTTGDTKSCPNVGIWDDYQSCSPNWYNNANHWKAQSFFELWYLTGEPILKDFGIRACNRPMTFDFMGGQERSTGHILEGLSAAYEATWDVKYRDRMRVYFRSIIDARTTTPTANYFQNGIVGEGLMYQWFADPGYTHIGEQLKAWGDFLYANQTEYVWGRDIIQSCWLLNGLSVLRELYPDNNNYKVLSDSIWNYYITSGQVTTTWAKLFNEQYRGPAHFLKYLLADTNYLSQYPDYLNASAIKNESSHFMEQENLTITPNPFTCGNIRFQLSRPTGELVIYELTGKAIRHLAVKENLQWDGRNETGGKIGSGVYVVRWQDKGRLVARQRLIAIR